MKETEEETFVRVFNKMIQEEHGCKDFADYWNACKKVPDCVNYSQWLQVVKEYASERLKLSLPSEEEIEKEFGGRGDTGKFEQAVWIMYDYMKNKIYGQI